MLVLCNFLSSHLWVKLGVLFWLFFFLRKTLQWKNRSSYRCLFNRRIIKARKDLLRSSRPTVDLLPWHPLTMFFSIISTHSLSLSPQKERYHYCFPLTPGKSGLSSSLSNVASISQLHYLCPASHSLGFWTLLSFRASPTILDF